LEGHPSDWYLASALPERCSVCSLVPQITYTTELDCCDLKVVYYTLSLRTASAFAEGASSLALSTAPEVSPSWLTVL